MLRKTCLALALLAALLPSSHAQRTRPQIPGIEAPPRRVENVEVQDRGAELSELERLVARSEPARTIAQIPAPFIEAIKREYERSPEIQKETNFERYLAGRYFWTIESANLKLGPIKIKLPMVSNMCADGACDAPLDKTFWAGSFTGQVAANISDPNLPTQAWTNGLYPNAVTGPPSDTACGAPATEAHHTIVLNGNDPVIPTLKTVAPTPTTNPASLRLGNRCPIYGGERVTKTFTVDPAQPILQFWYASVFQDPQHDPTIQPGFSAYLLRSDGTQLPGLLDLDVLKPGAQNAIIADRNNPFFGFDPSQQVVYTNWNCVTADLSSLAGQTVTLVLVNRDCDAGGHWGYTYIDSFCMGCAGTMTGDAAFNPAKSDCARGAVCFDYTVPKTTNGATGQVNLTLSLYQNGVLAGTLASGPLTSNGTYCFQNVWAGLNQAIGFDWRATANFSLPGSTYQIAPKFIGKEGDGNVAGRNNDCAAPVKPTDPCCPPWDKERLKDSMVYKGSGSIGAPYTLSFDKTPVDGPMSIYIKYLNSLNANITDITIDWSLLDGGTSSVSVPGAQVGGPVSTTWNSGGGLQNFTAFFNGFPMQVGRWYRVRTVIHLNNGQKFFPEKCAVVEMDVRIQVIGARMRDGAAPPAVLEFGDGTSKPIQSGTAPPATRERLRR